MAKIEDSMSIIKKIYTDISEGYMEQLAKGGHHDLEIEHIIDSLAYTWEYLNEQMGKDKTDRPI